MLLPPVAITKLQFGYNFVTATLLGLGALVWNPMLTLEFR